jgi:hypothetical protein
MSYANNFSIGRDSASSVNITSRVMIGATNLYTDPAYYVNNTLQWQFRSVPDPVPEQAPNKLERLINTGLFPEQALF